MRRILSTYMFVSRKLTAELLGQIAEAEFEAVEIFGTRGHFDYTTKQEIQAIASALSQHGLTLASLHAPTSRDLSATREGGTPLSITEVERVRRIEAMDELKRVIDVAEDLPFSTSNPTHGRIARDSRPTQARCGLQFAGASGFACASSRRDHRR